MSHTHPSLHSDVVCDVVDAHPLPEAEGHRDHGRHDHAHAQEVAEVDALGDHAREEHSERVGEEVGGVQRAKEPLGVRLVLALDLGWKKRQGELNWVPTGLCGPSDKPSHRHS